MSIRIRSEGCDDPGITEDTCGLAYINVNGEDKSHHIRGHNVVVVDAVTGKVTLVVEHPVKTVCSLRIVFSGYSPITDENIHDKKLNKTECFEYASVSVKGSCNGSDRWKNVKDNNCNALYSIWFRTHARIFVLRHILSKRTNCLLPRIDDIQLKRK